MEQIWKHRMQEMTFPGFKFQKFSGGVLPKTPPFMRGILATHVAFSHCYPPLTERSLFKKCPPTGKSLKKALYGPRLISRSPDLSLTDVPRQLLGIIVCAVYYLSGLHAQTHHCFNEHLIITVDTLHIQYPNCGLLFLGQVISDFDNFDISNLLSSHGLNQVVQSPCIQMFG